MATAVAVLLLVGIGLLVSRSGTIAPTASPSGRSTGSSPATSSNANSGGTQQAAPPPNSATGGSQASGGSANGGSAGAATSSSGATGSSAPGSAAVQGVGGTAPLPNTGAPFPWWLGLLPLAIGILMIAALRRRPAAALSARSRTVSFDTSIELPPPSRIRAGERWFFAGELDGIDADAERPLVGGRAF
ncbi:MAG TPA: hypothetical protein VKY26_08160 [Actinomycetota bacterium]|nr:hypothetical protein [Actinomycetota bacterium]